MLLEGEAAEPVCVLAGDRIEVAVCVLLSALFTSLSPSGMSRLSRGGAGVPKNAVLRARNAKPWAGGSGPSWNYVLCMSGISCDSPKMRGREKKNGVDPRLQKGAL